jgi:uncharacterized membrane protein YraQ (UPF0718 family)
MKYLYLITLLFLLISLFTSITKTLLSLKIAWKKFAAILPLFLTMISILSIVMLILPADKISSILSAQNNWMALIIAITIGSIVFVPGFIAYPLAAVLLENGLPYYVIAGFTTSLMLVGFASLPVEIAYYGKKLALLRNLSGFFISFLIAITIGFLYGEF